VSHRLTFVLVLTCTAVQACATGTSHLRQQAGEQAPSERRQTAEAPREIAPRPDFVIPALEIVGVQAGINAVSRRYFNDGGAFNVSPASVRHNLRTRWVVDDDIYEINQAGHPYQGSLYHGIARSAGLNYWQSAAYTFVGSALWEIAGETSRPSINDQIASGVAGSFLGETLFRTANLLIDKSGNRPGPARMVLVTLLAPATAFNRGVFGGRFDRVMPTGDPMYDARVQVGASGAVTSSSRSRLRVQQDETVVDASIEYGLPGTPSYEYRRPFDYYSLHATVSSANGFESVMTRGLIVGGDYAHGPRLRGVWGLYGIYDYLSPQVFRVSTTALSVGSNVQAWLSQSVAVQGMALGGLGYAAAQTLTASDRPYHYGVAPQAVAALRLVAGDRASLDVSAREYFVSGIGGLDDFRRDTILRGEVSAGVRVYKRNAVSVRYLVSRRDVGVPGGPSLRLSRATVGLFYTLLGPQHFGAVDWRQ
jgi:hypothetical protein